MRAISYVRLLGREGFLMKFIINLFNLKHPLFSIYNIWGVIFILGTSYFPYICLLTIAGLKTLDRRLEESANLYVKGYRRFFKITLPLISPYIISAIIFISILSFSATATPEFLRVNTYSLEVYVQFCGYYNFQNALLISLPIIFITILLGLSLVKLLAGKPLVNYETGFKEIKKSDKKTHKFIAIFYIGIIFFISSILPLIVLLHEAKGFFSILNEIKMSWEEIINSFFLSITGASFALFLILPLSYLIAKYKKNFTGKILNALTLIPFAIPAPIIALGLIKITNRPTTMVIYSSSIILLISYIIMFHPYGIRILYPAFSGINKEIIDAGKIFSSKFTPIFSKIVFPLVNPFIITTWIILLLLCFQELSAGLILRPPGESTLPIKIEALIHYGDWQKVSILCLIQIILTISIIIIFIPYLKKIYKK
jgi:iron(III) transport system permease protein